MGEIGRIGYLASGPEQGKIAAIVNGPTSGVRRQAYPLKQIHLTNFKVNFPFDAPTKIVRKELNAAKVDEQWAESAWSKQIVNKAKRAAMTDFDRFKLRKAKKLRNRIVTVALNQKKKALRKAGKL